jgi:hypothetical protein
MEKTHFTLIMKLIQLIMKANSYFLLYIIGNILPRVILINVFVIEIFYYNKISMFYKILPITLITLGFQYLYYSCNKILTTQCCLLDESIDIHLVVHNTITNRINSFQYIHGTVIRHLGLDSTDFDCSINMSASFIDKTFERHNVSSKTHNYNHILGIERRQHLINNLLQISI